MKKGVLVVASLGVIVLILSLFFLYYDDGFKMVYENSESNSVMKSNAITMLYETGYQSGEYQVVSDNTWPQEDYIFNETLSKCENGSKIYWDSNINRIMVEANNADKCYVYFAKGPIPLADYIINEVYTGTDGDNGLYYHDGVGTYTNAEQEAGDNSYRYAGANPNNYVCFGSATTPCPEENLYRIIGVFDNKVKLVKYLSAGTSSWSDNSFNNTWNPSQNDFPIIKEELNEDFYGSIENSWQHFIVESKWQVGGLLEDDVNNIVNHVFQYEVGAGKNDISDLMKIGLIYVSDYGYAASPDYWQTSLNNYDVVVNSDENWLFNENSWTLSLFRNSNPLLFGTAFAIDGSGKIQGTTATILSTLNIYPAFYLSDEAKIYSGTGTKEDPYRLILSFEITLPPELVEMADRLPFFESNIFLCENAMTWNNWINSSYNQSIGVFYLEANSNKIFLTFDENNTNLGILRPFLESLILLYGGYENLYIVDENYVPVKPGDIIINDNSYYVFSDNLISIN